MKKRQPPNRDTAPIAARYRAQYRKHGRLRFASARDLQRSLERAIRRAGVPIAFSAGFSPHPKISYTDTVATGASSEMEFFELGLTREVDPAQLGTALDAALPDGFDIVEVVAVRTPDFAQRLTASRWRILLPGTPIADVQEATTTFLGMESLLVERLTKSGKKAIDVRAAVVSMAVTGSEQSATQEQPCAILHMVVRHVVPSVRPVDILTGLHQGAGLAPSQTPKILREAQGPLDSEGIAIGDPMEPDRVESASA